MLPLRWKDKLSTVYVLLIASWTLGIHRAMFSFGNNPVAEFFWSIRPVGFETQYLLALMFSPLAFTLPFVFPKILNRIQKLRTRTRYRPSSNSIPNGRRFQQSTR